ncbi:PTS sugar transporter subunit IIA [Corynebacterium lowii]|uniref:PTS system glucose-specific EIICBA component n=1 Tax=Corynebacterium lowii TaxID=1544413 RepID=A0A0Q0YUE2_9CORY|nr:PTS glucose transporter subunit IIA [Corynebacterium lowii]KQB85979.1 PTS system glucose-specific EIICBA component [Corynebacterium lowii]MDP9850591.1 glucose-specific phosphotransferase system IIA component [Corynebacterium lowii]
MSSKVQAPLAGAVIPMSEVKDEVFASGMVGAGVAVVPEATGTHTVVAPLDGTLQQVLPHAFIVLHESGAGVLVHVGIDTVELEGKGFEVHKAKGEAVRAGEPVVTIDAAAVSAAGYDLTCPVVAMQGTLGEVTSATQVNAGDTLYEVSA